MAASYDRKMVIFASISVCVAVLKLFCKSLGSISRWIATQAKEKGFFGSRRANNHLLAFLMKCFSHAAVPKASQIVRAMIAAKRFLSGFVSLWGVSSFS